MKQMIRVYQEIFRNKFLLVLGTLFLLIPTIVYSQESIPEHPDQAWKPNSGAVQSIRPQLPFQLSPGPQYGSIVMMQKPIACNDTPVVKNHIQTNGGMKPVTLGTNLNSMGAITSLIQVYANPTNKQFAIVEHFAAQKSCILVQGYNFDILMQLYETF